MLASVLKDISPYEAGAFLVSSFLAVAKSIGSKQEKKKRNSHNLREKCRKAKRAIYEMEEKELEELTRWLRETWEERGTGRGTPEFFFTLLVILWL